MKKQIVVAAVLSLAPLAAFAGPSLGIGYTNIGLSGHPGRPGVTLTAGNLYSNNVMATGSATLANGYYGFHADLGKLIPAGGVSFKPYLSMGFLSLNYNQQVAGGIVTTHPSPYLTEFTQSYYTQQQSIQDFFALAGADMNVPIGSHVMLEFGGGYGHTLMTYGGSGGAVYQGKAEAAFEIAPRVTANINVRYVHVPSASLTNEGVGLSYHFS